MECDMRFEKGNICMKFLNICSVRQINESYIGVINPYIYSGWNEIDALILFFEGINQFSVKLVKMSEKIDKTQCRNSNYLPVQMRDLTIHIEPGYAIYRLNGKMEKHGNIHKIDFSVFKKNQKNECASGSIYVAEIILGRFQ
jgi:hypothetical protein